MKYGMYEILESGDYTGKREYSIYDNGEYICTTIDSEIAEQIKEALEIQIPKKPPGELFLQDNGVVTNICGCKHIVTDYDVYCNKCGQKLEWD